MLTVVAALIGILVGGFLAAVLLLTLSRSRVRSAESERARILADAGREAEAVRREAQVEAREQAVQLRTEIESEVQGRRLEIAKVEERVLQKEADAEEKLTELVGGLDDRRVLGGCHHRAPQDEHRSQGRRT